MEKKITVNLREGKIIQYLSTFLFLSFVYAANSFILSLFLHAIPHFLSHFLSPFFLSFFLSLPLFRRHSRCKDYHGWKWMRWFEFKALTMLFVFQIDLMPLGKVWIQILSLPVISKYRVDWATNKKKKIWFPCSSNLLKNWPCVAFSLRDRFGKVFI